MKELVKNGYEVYAVCPRGEVFDRFKDFGIKTVAYKIDRGSLNIFKELKTIRNIKKVIYKIDPDILHTFMHKPNIYGNLIKHKCTINTITGLGSFFIHNDIKSKIIKNIIILGYKLTTKHTKKIIFQNSDDLKLFSEFLPKEKLVLIKSSGIDTNEFKPIEKLQNKKPIVLMIARVIKDKGVEEFIKAGNLLKDKAQFVYVGDKDTGNKNTFNPEWGSVKYLGFRRDIKELISKCDIFVLPSYYGEGVPRTLIEAASMAKPIVTTNWVGCREVVEDNKNGFLVPVKDYKILAKKIELLIDSPSLREKFAKYSRIKAKKEFDIKVVVKKYMEVYEDLKCIKR